MKNLLNFFRMGGGNFPIRNTLSLASRFDLKWKYCPFLMLLVFFLIQGYGCRKDQLENISETKLSLERAKEMFYNRHNSQATYKTEDPLGYKDVDGFKPIWPAAKYSLIAEKYEVISVPLWDKNNTIKGAGTNLFFYTDQVTGELDYTYLSYIPTADYSSENDGHSSLVDFTGYIIPISSKGRLYSINVIENGKWVGLHQIPWKTYQAMPDDMCPICHEATGGCNQSSVGHFLSEHIWAPIVNFLNGLVNGNGNSSNNGNGNSSNNSNGNSSNNGNGNGSNNGSSTINLWPMIGSSELIETSYPSGGGVLESGCFGPGSTGYPELVFAPFLQSFGLTGDSWTYYNEDLSVFYNDNNQLTLIDGYTGIAGSNFCETLPIMGHFFNIDAFDGELAEIMKLANEFTLVHGLEEYGASPVLDYLLTECGIEFDYLSIREALFFNPTDCITELIDNPSSVLGNTAIYTPPTPAEIALELGIESFVTNTVDLTTINSILDFLAANDYIKKRILDFIESYEYSPSASEYGAMAAYMIMTYPDYKWARFEELYELLEDNPNALIEECFNDNPQYPLSFWNDLINFQPPQSVIDHCEHLNYSIQNMQHAWAPYVNLDYFSLTISDLPIINGVQSTPGEFIEYIRLNFSDFDDDNLGEFSIIPSDVNMWGSSIPLGTIFTINIAPIAGFLGDDGSITCSSYDDGCCWVFTTLNDHNDNYQSDGTHPVSGNRQFGIISNQNGTYTFYTKGADRASTWFDNLISSYIYDGGTALWNTVITNVRNFVGIDNSTLVIPEVKKTNWMALKVMLQSNQIIDHVPCID